MTKKLDALALRQYLLIEKIESQRNEVADFALSLKTPLSVADSGIKAARFLHNHPALVSGGMAALVSWRKNGFVGMALQGWRALYLYPDILAYVSKYLHFPNRHPKKNDPTDTAI